MNKGAVWNSIQVTGKVRVNNSSMAGVNQLVDVPYGVQRAAVWPIGVLFRLQIGLEDRSENQNCRHHRCPVAESGYA